MKRNTVIVSVVALILAALAWGAFVFMLGLESGARTELANLKSKQDEYQARSTFAESVRQLTEDTAQDREKLNALTADQDIVEVIKLLEEAGDSAGARVSVEAVSVSGEEQILKTVTVVLDATGEFSELFHYLSLLETIPVPSLIEQGEIETDPLNNDAWRSTVRLRLFAESI